MKTVVITGSTRGIGYGLAEAFLTHQCNVVISGRQQSSVDDAVARLRAQFPAERIHGAACDITDYAQVQALWDSAKAQFASVDIWINNAAIVLPPGLLADFDPEAVANVVNTNLTGVFYGCHVAIRGMNAQGGGHIYNMEGLGSRGEYNRGNSPYGMAKYGMKYMTDALIDETKDQAVKVSALSPGMVVTDMLMQTIAPEREQQAHRIFNILADRVETVTPWLAEHILANDKAGVRIAWLTTPKIVLRFLTSPFRRRRNVMA